MRKKTPRFLLRPLVPSDEAAWVGMFLASRDAWGPWVPAADPALTPAGRFRIELERTVRGAEAGTHVRLAAVAERGKIVGMFALNEIVRGVLQSAHASWHVSAPHMGKGLGTQGVEALLDIAFAEPPSGLGLHRVQANIMPANGPSLRIAEKVGLRPEGRAERYLFIAGRWEDHLVHAITREEWPGDD